MDFENTAHQCGSLRMRMEVFIDEVEHSVRHIKTTSTWYKYLLSLQGLLELVQEEVFEVKEERRRMNNGL